MESEFIELTYAGSLRLEKITFRKASVSNVQKPKSGNCGCIVQVMTEKFPVVESYEFVRKAIGAKAL